MRAHPVTLVSLDEPMRSRRDETLAFHPLTPERWDDFETLFGESGAYGGCWCMWWRETRAEFERRQGEGNRAAMEEIVRSGEVTGILAYEGNRAVGWCSIAPRERFGSLERSPVLRRLDEEPVWSIVCLFVDSDRRGRGLSEALIRAAVDHAASRGATLVEAYPSRPRGKRLPPVSSFMGIPEVFARAGFEESARPSEAKIVMRRRLE